VHANDPREDLERLMRDAAEGVPVAGRPATWEAGRPGQLPAGQPVKHRGFIDYSRCARRSAAGARWPEGSAARGGERWAAGGGACGRGAAKGASWFGRWSLV